MLNVSTVEERQARIRKLNAEAEARELKNAQLRGELYEAAEVERQVAELTSRIRLRLESIPGELQTEWPAELQAVVTQRMSDKLHLILTEMSHWRLEVPANVSTGDSELPTASADSDDSVEPGERTDA
jgi:phage terminase Nu1 subunit (DNA packaging protein)